jgi:LacI family transcriptional regulator, repressor for deo operon, udp, cdd, tsx, nupC, and nupG
MPMPHDEMLPPVTSVDVAQRAGVSQSAVSLVFGGKAAGRVGRQTQEAILRAAHELGYQPNRAARSLRSGRSRLIVLAVPDVSNPYFAAVLQGAEQAARQHGYTVLLASVRDERDWQQVVLDALASRSVDGFLFFTLSPPTEAAQIALQGRALLVDAASPALPSLLLDVEAGMHAAMQHLLRLGHSRIAHLAAAVDAATFHLRHTAYLNALQAAGLPITAAYQARAAFSIADARQATHRILEAPDPPTAIVCDSDVLAVGVYKAARDVHRPIPESLSVVGFDDSMIARMLDPELSSVAIPTAVIGEQAFLLLLGVLEQGQAPPQAIAPLELVIRASTTGAKGV